MHLLLMYSTHVPSCEHVERLRALDARLRVTVAKDEAHAIRAAVDANVVFGHRYLRQCLPRARRLRWVQSTAGGTDRLPCVQLADRGVLLTRMSTISAPIIARHAVTLAWSLARCLPEAIGRQVRGEWRNDFRWLPLPRRAIVFGLGNIGRSIAACLHADGMEVVGVRQRAIAENIPGCDRVVWGDAWQHELQHADWCFLALPITPQTRGMFSRDALYSLPRHALLINVGRGSTVDTQALRHMLLSGHLGGAALDVVEPRPPADNPLWNTPRLLLTPHVAAHCHERPEGIERFCEEQLRRFISGRPLQDVVPRPDGELAA